MTEFPFDDQDIARFKSKVLILPTGCHRWTDSLSGGYGNFTAKKIRVKAHRFSFWIEHGYIPERPMCIDHICNNRWCVNPSHLQEVTYSKNTTRSDPSSYRRSDQALCAAGLHPWVPSNLVKSGPYLTCRQCKLAGQRHRYHQSKQRTG